MQRRSLAVYKNIWNLKEGMREWQKKGFPLLNKRQGGDK